MKQKIEELEKFNELAVGRELEMIELKREVNQLLHRLGEVEKYKIVDYERKDRKYSGINVRELSD